MIRGFLALLILCLIPSSLWAKESLLDIKISISITNTPVKNILETIEEKGKVEFTYSPDIVDEKRLVNLNLKNETIGYGLGLIFDHTIRFKEVGTHIVLLKNEEKKEIKQRKKEKQEHTFSGLVTDKKTGNPIVGASVYDVDARYAVLTDEQGKYLLTIPHSEDIRSLYFDRKGYHEVIIIVDLDGGTASKHNIQLERELTDIEKIDPSEIGRLPQTFQEKAISGIWVSDEAYMHGENLEEIEEERLFQISLVPSVSIGSNLSTNALITNNVSLNVISGYSSGVNGVEVGGILNIVKGDTRWFQGAGIANINGGNVSGIQIGGISNLVTGNILGFQGAGITNMCKQNLFGIQVAGISNILRGGFTGVQASGICNFAWENSHGLQVAGIANVAKSDLDGVQASGIVNFAMGGQNFFQASGIANRCRINNGLQATGIVNYAEFNNTLQIGLINVSKKSRGVAIGLINFVYEGYHALELGYNTLGFLDLIIKSGSQRLYNTYGAGIRLGDTKPDYTFSLGLGSYFNLGNRFRVSSEASYNLIFEDEINWNQTTQMIKIEPTIDWNFSQNLALYLGPAFNMNFMFNQTDNGSFYGDFPDLIQFSEKTSQSFKNSYSLGFRAGIRLFHH